MYPLFYINLLPSITIETTIAKIKEHCKTCRRVWKKIFCFLQTLSNRATQKKKEGGTIGNKALLVYFRWKSSTRLFIDEIKYSVERVGFREESGDSNFSIV